MYNIEYYKKEKEKILKECYFTKRQQGIFEEFIAGTTIKDMPKKFNCCIRTIGYDLKYIKETVENYRKGEDNNYFYVYVHIFPNGKKYIGSTENTIKRWGKDGLPYKKNIKMYEDIIKYGWNNIKHEILLKTKDEQEAKKLESKLIQIFDLKNKDNGYNER